jgi:hypothetical protein
MRFRPRLGSRLMKAVPTRFVLAVIVLLLAGCPVDDRKLVAGGGSGGSAGSAGVAGASTTAGRGGTSHGGNASGSEGGAAGDPAGAPSEAGAAGASDRGPKLVGGCVDLDDNGVGDCNESLLENPGFKQGVESWTADVGAALSWSDGNASIDLPSGSARVTAEGSVDMDGLVAAAAGQCVPIAEGEELKILANAFIPPDQGEGIAGLSIFFFDKANCMGSIKESFNASGVDTDEWMVLGGAKTVGAGVLSMRVRLMASKPYRSPTFEVQFDNVLVSKR